LIHLIAAPAATAHSIQIAAGTIIYILRCKQWNISGIIAVIRERIKTYHMSRSSNHAAKSGAEKNKAGLAHKQQTGASSSEPQEKTKDETSRRNSAVASGKLHQLHTEERNFDLLIDGVPYIIRSVPFLFNEEWRFRISVNGDEGHVFTWDSEAKMLRAIDDEASTLPVGLEEAISDKLQRY
jgi:hypothetical protein